jgi:hypothetical protein
MEKVSFGALGAFVSFGELWLAFDLELGSWLWFLRFCELWSFGELG